MINDDTLKSIENLHRLKTDGIITEEEFEKSKEKLLFGSKPAFAGFGTSQTYAPPAYDDYLGWITLPFKRWSDFTGRSSRREFWFFQLIPLAILVVAAIFVSVDTDTYGQYGPIAKIAIALAILALAGVAVPQVAVEVRRLHDQNMSGWFVLLNLIPYVGALIILVMMLQQGTDGDNAFGPKP